MLGIVLSWKPCLQKPNTRPYFDPDKSGPTRSRPTFKRSILMLSSCLHVCLPSDLLRTGYQDQNFVCISHLFHMHYMACPFRPPALNTIIIIFGKDDNYEALHAIFSILLCRQLALKVCMGKC